MSAYLYIYLVSQFLTATGTVQMGAGESSANRKDLKVQRVHGSRSIRIRLRRLPSRASRLHDIRNRQIDHMQCALSLDQIRSMLHVQLATPRKADRLVTEFFLRI